MCYVIYLSTTSEEALDDLPRDLCRFAPVTDADDMELVELLAHPQRWYLESRYGGCSCHFRHLGGESDMCFDPPEEWCPEDDDDVESTAAVYDFLARIVESGHKLDIISAWNGTSPQEIKDLPVSLHAVPRDSFRFFENYRFILSS